MGLVGGVQWGGGWVRLGWTLPTRENFCVPQGRRNHRSNLSTLRLRGALHRTWNCLWGLASRRSHGALPLSASAAQPHGARTGPFPCRPFRPGPSVFTQGLAPLGFSGLAPWQSLAPCRSRLLGPSFPAVARGSTPLCF